MRSVGDSQRERERERGDITQHMYATKQCVRLFEHAIPNTVLCFWILAHCMYCLIVLFVFFFFFNLKIFEFWEIILEMEMLFKKLKDFEF